MASILVVDSDADSREMYAEFLRASGCRVATAATVEEAVVRLQAHTPDLLITELALPGTDGIALCRQVRANSAWRGLPILVVTAMAHPHYSAHAKVAGATRIILKPAPPDLVYQQSLIMIARWPLVARQAASLHRCALEVADRIASQPGRDAGSGWERDVVTTDAGTAVGAIVSDKSGGHLGSNRTATDLTGFSHREMLARSIWDLVPPAQREESRASWRWFQQNGVLHGSATIVAKNGEPRELQYFALADVVPGAHLSVFVPHPFEAALDLAERGLGRG
jgi:two-component system, chemotaxis family, chemotaxis protein CheY